MCLIMAKKKTDRTRKTAPKAGSGKTSAKAPKSAKPATKASKSAKSAKKAPKSRKTAKPKAGAEHDFPQAVRDIMRDARTPMTLDQIHEEHTDRFKVGSRASVKSAVVSLVASNALSVVDPGAARPDVAALAAAAACVVRDDTRSAIEDLLCQCYPGRSFTNVEIHDTLNAPPLSKGFLKITIDATLPLLVIDNVIQQNGDGTYKCG
jgi:hypothetical protein